MTKRRPLIDADGEVRDLDNAFFAKARRGRPAALNREAFESVWDAIEDTSAEAENMRMRAQLMRELERVIRERGWSQAEAAQRLGLTQPRVSELLRGKIDLRPGSGWRFVP